MMEDFITKYDLDKDGSVTFEEVKKAVKDAGIKLISCPVNDLLYEPSPRPLGTPLPCLGEGTGARAGYRKRLCGHDITR